jgi:hypothetical protein
MAKRLQDISERESKPDKQYVAKAVLQTIVVYQIYLNKEYFKPNIS